MNEKENIKKIYDQIHAPEALLGKVMEMKKDTFKFRNCVKYAVAAVAALALTFVASNGICYAATGETWISKIKVNINGNEVTPDVTWKEEDGNMVGTFEMELDSVDEETGEKDKVFAQIEVQPDGVNAEDVDGLEDTTVLTIVTTGEDNSVTVEQADDELNLSIDTDKAE
ncbi:MAG: hypothetical protein IKT67_02645 [Lachnospiraceae bacterium]|nr:hypothetical protein [Lachnospiraceae bacterium]